MTISLDDARTHVTEHSITVGAPVGVIYDLIADVTRWPYVFGPTVHVELLPNEGAKQRLRIWATANGEVRTWTSGRELDAAAGRIRFRQEVSSPPVETMGGEWILEPLSDTETKVVLLHDFRTVGDNQDDTTFIVAATDRNSTAELAALKHAAELGDRMSDLVLTFTDTVHIDAPPGPVYEFLHRVQDWPEKLPHVARLELTEPAPDLQVMEMDTRSGDGPVHTTHSVRVCFRPESIVYKQTRTPEIMAAHTGRWSVRGDGGGTEVSSTHTVFIRPEKVTEVLGPDGTVAKAREMIRTALGTNSTTTMTRAKEAAESGR